MRVRPLRLLLALAAAWVVLGGLLLLLAARDLQQGVDEVRAARDALGPEDLATPEPARRLQRAEERFDRAARLLGNPLVVPARWVPVAGRQLRTVTALAGAARTVAGTGRRAAVDARTALEEPSSSAGADRLVLLERLRTIVARTRRDVRTVDLGPSEALVGPVRHRQDRFATELDVIRRGLTDADAGLAAMVDLLRGPRRYLVLAANNAEMRAGSGTFLSVGVLTTSEGRLELGTFESAGDLTLPPPGPPMPADLAARWGWAEPNREWRNLGLSPRFEVNGALAAAMWEARTGEHVDGAIALDVPALEALLEATGPVQAGGEEIAADDVEDLLLHDQYVDAGAELGGEQQARRERLGQIASAAVAALEGGDVDAAALGSRLVDAAAGRHVMLWAADPAVERGWQATGVAGELPADALLVAVVNRGANKLDRFLAVESTFSTRADGDDTTVEVRIVLDNRTPAGEIPYVAGPNPETGTAEGEYRGIVAVSVPGRAGRVGLGDGPLVVAGADGPTRVVGREVRVARGERQELVARFTVAGRHGRVRLIPSARVLPMEWRRAGTEPFNDGLGRTLSW